MTTPAGSEVEGLPDSVVQLRFRDDEGTLHDLGAAEVAEVLQGMVEFISQMAKAGLFGDVVPPEVRIRPPQQGSFVIDAVLHFTQTETWVAAGEIISAAGGVITTVNVAARKLRGVRVTDFDHLPNGNVKIKWSDGDVSELPAKTWDELNAQKKKTKKALGKITAPLSTGGIRLEVRGAGAEEDTDEVLARPPGGVLELNDYREAVAVTPDPQDQVSIFEIEATLTSVDFREGKGWRVEVQQDGRRTQRSVEVEDREFLRSLDQGRPLHKDDILRVKIRQVAKVRNERNSTEWAIIEVLSQRRGGGSDEDDRAAADRPEPAEAA